MMLSYGWVFHMGFFNFYLATGLSLWALAVRPWWAKALLLGIAYTGHILPPLWAVVVICYSLAAEKTGTKGRLMLLTGCICGVIGLNFWLIHHYRTFASFHQVLEAGAVDQIWVFGLKYAAISILLALFWGFLLLGVTKKRGFDDVAFHLCVLTGFAILILPTRIELPQYNAALSFITERMTLPYGVLICAFLAAAILRSGFAFPSCRWRWSIFHFCSSMSGLQQDRSDYGELVNRFRPPIGFSLRSTILPAAFSSGAICWTASAWQVSQLCEL